MRAHAEDDIRIEWKCITCRKRVRVGKLYCDQHEWKVR